MDNYLVSVSLILSFSLTVIGDTSVCHSNADGHYEIGCRSYVICTGGRGVIHNCPDPPAQETVYNSAKGHCDNPDNVARPCGHWQDCSKLPDKRYPDIYTNCTSYYTCHGGTFFGHNYCNPGLVFDSMLQLCNWPHNVAPPCGTFGTKK
ncbi:chitin-binding domain protein cbd-1 [Magallana gigas]|uniref:Chitin-binding type-2 domain-containing protein n=1 Tax=Magallana gigas TaxID=29159 RepID=A0A8W8KZD5_MAGGI|nr:uncharacterized protein LOC105319278 [Crassostrea gigas]